MVEAELPGISNLDFGIKIYAHASDEVGTYICSTHDVLWKVAVCTTSGGWSYKEMCSFCFAGFPLCLQRILPSALQSSNKRDFDKITAWQHRTLSFLSAEGLLSVLRMAWGAVEILRTS